MPETIKKNLVCLQVVGYSRLPLLDNKSEVIDMKPRISRLILVNIMFIKIYEIYFM